MEITPESVSTTVSVSIHPSVQAIHWPVSLSCLDAPVSFSISVRGIEQTTGGRCHSFPDINCELHSMLVILATGNAVNCAKRGRTDLVAIRSRRRQGDNASSEWAIHIHSH